MFKKHNNTKTLQEIGAEGEQQIYNVLIQLLGKQAVFRNVYVRRPSGYLTEIDLLAIHAVGVFVVESKNYLGIVTGDGECQNFLHIRSSGSKRSFYSPVKQNAGHVQALREACQYHLGFTPPMLSLIVFPDRCKLDITGLPQGLRCCLLGQIPIVLQRAVQSVVPVLSNDELSAMGKLFYSSQRSELPDSVVKQHLRDVVMVRNFTKNT